MSQGQLKLFYGRSAWIKCRKAFFASKFGLCEQCGSKGEEVHHKDPITAWDTVNNPEKCYSWNNLELLCRKCHEQTRARHDDELKFDANGDIVWVEKVDAKQL